MTVQPDVSDFPNTMLCPDANVSSKNQHNTVIIIHVLIRAKK